MVKKIFLNKIQGIEGVSFIFELIPILKENGWIRSYHHLYSKHLIEEKAFTLRTYTMEDIMTRINVIINDKR